MMKSEHWPYDVRYSPLVGIITGFAAVSSASIFIRCTQREAPSLVIAAARLTLASLILVPLRFTSVCLRPMSRSGATPCLERRLFFQRLDRAKAEQDRQIVNDLQAT